MDLKVAPVDPAVAVDPAASAASVAGVGPEILVSLGGFSRRSFAHPIAGGGGQRSQGTISRLSS